VQQQQVLNAVEWEMTRRFFDGASGAAEAQRRTLREALERSKSPAKRAELSEELGQMEQMIEAAKVKPVAGRLPRNHQYAGKEMPVDADTVRVLKQKEINAPAVRFTEDGFPDFSPWVAKDVRIVLTGRVQSDIEVANRLAGWRSTPKGYRWHHHQELGRMQLVPDRLHTAVGHTGGTAGYKHVTGDLTAYK
jgi:hypothetical protein